MKTKTSCFSHNASHNHIVRGNNRRRQGDAHSSSRNGNESPANLTHSGVPDIANWLLFFFVGVYQRFDWCIRACECDSVLVPSSHQRWETSTKTINSHMLSCSHTVMWCLFLFRQTSAAFERKELSSVHRWRVAVMCVHKKHWRVRKICEPLMWKLFFFFAFLLSRIKSNMFSGLEHSATPTRKTLIHTFDW